MTDDDKFLDAVQLDLDQHYAEIRRVFAEGFDRMDRRFDRIDRKFDEINGIMDRIDENIDAIRKELR